MLYSTYLGGRGGDRGYGIAVDSSGNAYVTGFTDSPNFPAINVLQAILAGGDDAFIAKLNASGNALLYSTYFGGSDGDYGFGIAVDSSGNACVTGITGSSDFPVNEYQASESNVFVLKIVPSTASGCTFGDADGDGKADFGVWRPGEGVWYLLKSSSPGSYTSAHWGVDTDIPVAGDYDGDSMMDIAAWRPANGIWYILPSSAPGTFISTQWGLSTDIPVPADYDGDGKIDIAVWRPGNGIFYALSSKSPGSYTAIQWGLASDIPIIGRIQ